MPIIPPPKPSRRGTDALFSRRTQQTVEWLEDELKITLPDRPVSDMGQPLNPKLPAKLSVISNQDVWDLAGEFTAMLQYVTAQLALWEVTYTDDEYAADQEEARVGLTIEGGNKDDRNFRRVLVPAVQQRREAALTKKARKVLLTGLSKGYERAIATLSRELSRRGIDTEVT